MERRSFLFGSGAAALAATLGSGVLERLAAQNAPPIPSAAPDPAQFSDQERYWAEVRKLFLIPTDEVYLNNGTVGTSPWPVLNAIFEGYKNTEKMDQSDPEDYPIWGYGDWNQFRDPLAQFVGAERDEIAIV